MEERYGITPFNGNNFSQWLFRVTAVLEEKQIAYVIKNEIVNEEDKSKFIKNDVVAKSVVIQCIHDSHIEYIKNCSTTKEMIETLSKVFQRKGIISQLLLRKKLLSLKFTDGRLDEHFIQFDDLVNRLKEAGAKLEDQDIICHLLLTLPKRFDYVVTALETIQDRLTLELVKTRLLDEELKSSQDESTIQNSAFKTSFPFKCHHCHKVGHKKSDCFKFKKKVQLSSRGNSIHENKQMQTKRKGISQVNNVSMDNSLSFIASSSALSFNSITSGSGSEYISFVCDSGASEHMVQVDFKYLMSDVVKLQEPIKITLADGTNNLVAYEKGNLRFANFMLKDVLLVGNLNCNLLSISRIEANGGCIIFVNGNMIVRHEAKTVFYGQKRDKLFIARLRILMNSANYSWHERMGHPGRNAMRALENKLLVKNIQNDIKVCEPCFRGKMTRNPFVKEMPKSKRLLHTICSDVCGPISPVTFDGYRYFQTIIDDYSNFVMVFLLKEKSEVEENIKNYIESVERQFSHKGLKVVKLRCDNGGEYSSNEFRYWSKTTGIELEYTPTYTPQLNGKSERMNRTLLEKARSMMVIDDREIPKYLWGESVRCAAYLYNRTPRKNGIPAELWYNESIDYSKIKTFGSEVFAKINKPIGKLESRCKKMWMIGYASNCYRLFDPETKRIILSRDVKFTDVNKTQNTSPSYFRNENKLCAEEDKSDKQDEQSDIEIADCEEQFYEDHDDSKLDTNEVENEKSEEQEYRTRFGRKIKKPERFTDHDLNVAYSWLTNTKNDPNTIKEAINLPEWEKAINKEINSLENLNTWSVVELPKGKTAIETKWVFRTKESGVKKARLVAKGFQIKDDENNVYAPVARSTSIKMFLATAICKKEKILQLDIPSAFLNGNLESEVYIKPPECVNVEQGKVLKLNRALYGLKASPKCWNNEFDKFAQENGFKRSSYDFCVYIKKDAKMLLYVDDILITGKTEKIVESLQRKYNAKLMGEVSKFLGFEVRRSNEDLKIAQTEMIHKLLQRFNMTDCKSVSTPMEKGFNISEREEIINVPYRELIGGLMYVSLGTRPDITFSVSYLSRFLDKPTQQAWIAGKRILKYLKGTQTLALTYKIKPGKGIEGFSDADWAGDTKDRKSTSGSIIFYEGNPVYWSSKKQACVALSTAEAEYVAAAVTASELLNLRGLATDLGLNNETNLYVDNQAALKLSKSFENGKRSKHIDIKFHFIKDVVEKKIINLNYVESENNISDILTKPLSKDKFLKFRNQLNLS